MLDALAQADPDTILDNQPLIQTLAKTKKTTTEIEEQSKIAEKTEKQINILRENYRSVAVEASMLYFLVI